MPKTTSIEINQAWCKGCEICVQLCPTKTLEMKNLKASVKDLSKCTGCMQCELRCPDFAIEVIIAEEEKVK